MTLKQEIQELKNIASGQIPISGTNRLPYQEEIDAAKKELATIETKEVKSKARFLFLNEGKQKELRRRLKAIAFEKRRQADLARVKASKEAIQEGKMMISPNS